METGNHEIEIKSCVVPGVRVPGGTVRNCAALSGITPSNPIPSHPLAYGDLEETSSAVVVLRNDAGALSTPRHCNITPVVC